MYKKQKTTLLSRRLTVEGNKPIVKHGPALRWEVQWGSVQRWVPAGKGGRFPVKGLEWEIRMKILPLPQMFPMARDFTYCCLSLC